MEHKDFCYWLQGYLEISGAKELNAEQLQIVNEHLKLVFTKVTSSITQIPGRSIGGSIDISAAQVYSALSGSSRC